MLIILKILIFTAYENKKILIIFNIFEFSFIKIVFILIIFIEKPDFEKGKILLKFIL